MGSVVAGSFARIFFRNAVSLGLPVVECPEAGHGDELEVSLAEREVKNITVSRAYRFKPLPGLMLEMLQSCGLISFMREKLAAEN